MDNGAPFIGDLIHSRHFSRVVRLCLHLSVEPVFIASSKLWISGTIKDFNEILRRSCGNENNGQIRNTFEKRQKLSWCGTIIARTGSTERLIRRLYRTANLLRISRSVRIVCQSQRKKCTLSDGRREREQSVCWMRILMSGNCRVMNMSGLLWYETSVLS